MKSSCNLGQADGDIAEDEVWIRYSNTLKRIQLCCVARKDLQMSPGKLAAQCCHASLAFLLKIIRDGNITNADSIGYDEEKDMDEVVFF